LPAWLLLLEDELYFVCGDLGGGGRRVDGCEERVEGVVVV